MFLAYLTTLLAHTRFNFQRVACRGTGSIAFATIVGEYVTSTFALGKRSVASPLGARTFFMVEVAAGCIDWGERVGDHLADWESG